jgi:hypothetical protein
MSFLRASVSALAVAGLVLAAARPAAAQDVSRETDDIGAAGSSFTSNILINSTVPVFLIDEATSALSGAHGHTCTVTASAAVLFGGNGMYIFSLHLDGGGSQLAAERTIEFTDNPDNDEGFKPVSTNITLNVTPGNHTFTFRARKAAAANTNATVDSGTLSVECVRKSIE